MKLATAGKQFMRMMMMAAVMLPMVLAAGEGKAQYVFLFIGDGMGREQVRLTETVTGRKMCFSDFPAKALTTTFSACSKVTDSAAAGTAIACGVKTNNGVLGLDPQGKKVESIAVDAKRQGLKVGIVTSVPINHATPAAFYAHQKKRDMYDRITEDLLVSGFDYFGGSELLTKKKDDKNAVFRQLEAKGYKIIRDKDALGNVKAGEKYFVCRKIGLAIDERGKGLFSLADMVGTAILALDNDNGFFIMAEGGAIDWACHNNDAGAMIDEVTEFDAAIKVALRFAAAHPGQCLIVVTADHETGGLKFNAGKVNIEELRKQLANRSMFADNPADETKFKQALRSYFHNGGIEFSTFGHSASDIMTYAIGTGAEEFNGKLDNTDIIRKLRRQMGVKP